MSKDTIELQPAARELKLVLKNGYPFSEQEEQLRNSQVIDGMHVAHMDPYWISMWIADIVRSAKQIRSQGLLEKLDAFCDVLASAEKQNARVRGLILE
jgi:hypothetical protein